MNSATTQDTSLGQIIIVTGTSGAGKSTTCEQFVKQADDFWLITGIDHFMGSHFPRAYGHHGEKCQQGFYASPINPHDKSDDAPLRWHFGEHGHKAFAVFHEWIAASSRMGCNIILDHLLFDDPPILQDCLQRLQSLPVFLVKLDPPFDVLMERVAQRQIGQRFSNSNYSNAQLEASRQRLARLRPWFYESSRALSAYDLAVDSCAHNPEDIVRMIQQRLQQGPGTAFEQLRQQYEIRTAHD